MDPNGGIFLVFLVWLEVSFFLVVVRIVRAGSLVLRYYGSYGVSVVSGGALYALQCSMAKRWRDNAGVGFPIVLTP